MSTGTLRASYWAITINGSDYISDMGGDPANVLGIIVTSGFDQQVTEATITVETDDGAPTMGAWIEITMGATEGSATKRFAGYFMEFDYTLFPRQVGLICKSPLVRAQNFNNPAINGTDLSGSPSGSGQTDKDIVSQILTACGLTGDSNYAVQSPLGGLGRILGKVATQYYTWSEGDDGLSAIELIDEICQGYRTFDRIVSGTPTIVRQQVSIIPSGSPVTTFNQGIDILEATNQVSVISSRNLFLVTGYNASTAKHNTNGYKYPPSGPPTTSLPFPSQWSYSSSLIEYDTETARPSGHGVSCQEIAEWANGQYNIPIIKTPFTTQRDDEIDPGDLIGVIADHAAIGTTHGLTLFWVQNVTNQIDESGMYSQKLVAIQGGS